MSKVLGGAKISNGACYLLQTRSSYLKLLIRYIRYIRRSANTPKLV
ncbi:MAG: hypothetical protein IGS39_17930 [Calothrix sp. C42_A2020_038]|nr:hypothetical protein [Calothrix sp. C42_A2020_038]